MHFLLVWAEKLQKEAVFLSPCHRFILLWAEKYIIIPRSKELGQFRFVIQHSIVPKKIEQLQHFHLFQLTQYRIRIFLYKTLYFRSYLLVLLK